MSRSILIPPEVEPLQPQKREQMTRIPIERVGHRVVSCVANPVVVEMDATWNAASRSATPTELYPPPVNRSTVISTVHRATSPKNIRKTSDLRMFLWLPSTKVRKMRLKLAPEASMAMIRTTSAAGLPNVAMLALPLQNPQVLQADMAVVTASNHPKPVILKAKSVISVRTI